MRCGSEPSGSFNFKSVALSTLTAISYPRDMGRGISHQSSDLLRSKLQPEVSYCLHGGLWLFQQGRILFLHFQGEYPGFLCGTECPAWCTWIPTSQVCPVVCNMVGLPVTSVNVLEPGHEGGLLAAPPLPLSRGQPSDAMGVIWAFQNVTLAMLLPSPQLLMYRASVAPQVSDHSWKYLGYKHSGLGKD